MRTTNCRACGAPWDIAYRGEWPEPVWCAVRSLLTLRVWDGHRWVPDGYTDGIEPELTLHEVEACERCGAVRTRVHTSHFAT